MKIFSTTVKSPEDHLSPKIPDKSEILSMCLAKLKPLGSLHIAHIAHMTVLLSSSQVLHPPGGWIYCAREQWAMDKYVH